MSPIIKPETVEARERDEFNARQMERRRVALAVLTGLVTPDSPIRTDVETALVYADELIKQTEVKK